jgi:GH25 family lysozyme M1 (1,4-beta-N-acetylmuramidase)
MQPRVVDLSHHNTVKDFHAAAAAGVWGVIHKVSQSYNYADPEYKQRRIDATGAGLLWGAYHFCTGDDVTRQMEWFLAQANPDDQTLLALDYEDWRVSQMGIAQLIDACGYLTTKTGRAPVVYSGNTLKESIAGAGQHGAEFLGQHRLWVAQYGPAVKLPYGFSDWWLWQFSDGVINKGSAAVPGISGEVDLNTYQGTRDMLIAEWAGVPLATS